MPEKDQNKKKASSKRKQLKDYKLEKGRKTKGKEQARRKRRLGILLVVFAIVLAIIIIALLIEFKIINNPIENLLAQPQLFPIKDRCSLIVGQLIHSVGDEDVCEMRCKTECGVREMKFQSSEFEKRENDCNKCNCYCK